MQNICLINSCIGLFFYAQTYLTYRRFQMTVINGIAEFLFLFIYKFFSLNNRNNFWKGHILLPYYQSAKKKSFLYVCFIFRFKQLHHKEKPREIQSCYPICHLCVPHKHFWFVLSMLHRTASLHD